MKRADEKAFARRALEHVRRVDAAKAKPPPEQPKPVTMAGFWPIENRIWLDDDGFPEPEPIESSPLLHSYEVFRRHRR